MFPTHYKQFIHSAKNTLLRKALRNIRIHTNDYFFTKGDVNYNFYKGQTVQFESHKSVLEFLDALSVI